LAVVPDFEVVEDRIRKLDAGLSPPTVEEFDLHAGAERFDH
jgi:hypothetical protein